MNLRELNPDTSPESGSTRRRISNELLREEEWSVVADHLGLSPRESAVAHGLLDGGAERTIATELGLSTHTVHSYVWRIYRKAGVRSRHELTIRAFGMVRSLGPGTARDTREPCVSRLSRVP
jgi:DNA-binding NarL/FixJ family response regulator